MKIINSLKLTKYLLNHQLDKRKHQFRQTPQVEADIQSIVNEFTHKGYYVLDHFFSSEECEILKLKIDELVANSSNIKYYEQSNDYRQYGADRLSPTIKATFNENKFLQKVCSSFLNMPAHAHFTLGAKILANGQQLGSGGGWHRDTYLPYQFKAMVYLTDVEEHNGPFQLISGTHHWSSLYQVILKANLKPNSHRFTEEHIRQVLEIKNTELVTFTAPKGTCILFNSFAIHRGSPIKAGERYALTNYYFPDYWINLHKDQFEKKFRLPEIV